MIMHDGFLIQLSTQLLEPGRVRIQHFVIANPDERLACELLFAERGVTSDQALRITSKVPGSLFTALGMEEDEVRSVGPDWAEVSEPRAMHTETAPSQIAA